MTQLVWVLFLSTKIIKNFHRGGVPGFRILRDRKSWVSKDLYFRYYALRVHIFRILNTLLTVLSVCFTKHNFKIFWLPSPEGIRNISLGRAFTDSQARRNRPNRTGLDYVYCSMDVRTTENRARDFHLHNTNMTVR